MDFQVFSELPNKSVAEIKILFAGYHCRKGAVLPIFSVLNRKKKKKPNIFCIQWWENWNNESILKK